MWHAVWFTHPTELEPDETGDVFSSMNTQLVVPETFLHFSTTTLFRSRWTIGSPGTDPSHVTHMPCHDLCDNDVRYRALGTGVRPAGRTVRDRTINARAGRLAQVTSLDLRTESEIERNGIGGVWR